MTPVSRKRLEKETDELLSVLINSLFSNIKNKKEAANVIRILLTTTELKMLKKRLGIILLLNDGYTQEEISKITKTTRQTVARIRLQQLEIKPEELIIFNNKLKSATSSTLLKNVVKEIINLDISRSSMRRKISPF